MSFRFHCNRFRFVLLATAMMCGAAPSALLAADSKPRSTAAKSEKLPANIKHIIPHGRLLLRPEARPENTTLEVAYELGRLLQLDRDHCLLVASMDEQGGGDLCVGNNCFVIQKLSDISTAKAIPLNRAEYVSGAGGEKRFLAKYPALGMFVPHGARLADGKPHPAAGTGVLFSGTSTFRADKSTQDDKSKRTVEVLQLRWDGSNLKIESQGIFSKMLDLELTGSIPLVTCQQDVGLLFSLGTREHGVIVYRFDWNGKAWEPTRHGKPFAKTLTEGETSMRQQGDTFYLQTRCHSAEGHLYRSKDGLDFEFAATLDSHAGSPKVLNQGLDGSLYVVCNSSPGWVRNPLDAYPWENDHFGKPFILHDQDGVRGDKGNSKPFVDHAIASNVFLEGRWRHLVLYRVVDLMERSLHGFQLKQGFGDIVYGKGKGPIPRRPWSGLYAVELEYNYVTAPPYQFE